MSNAPVAPATYPENYLHRYRVEGCSNNDTHVCYTDPNTEPGFPRLLEGFKTKLQDLVDKQGAAATFYKFGDGDYYFLKGIPQGSATPGRRALSRDYSQIGHQNFVSGAQKCTFYTCELYPENRTKFGEVIPGKKIDYPAEFAYALVANKWLLRTFAGRIGVLGGLGKVEVIKDLMKHQVYQDYLGLRAFSDYITLPERFACDNLAETTQGVAVQLAKSNPDTRIYLCGMGHVKSGLLHRLPEFKNAVFLDVGTGVNMLAGCVSHYRPYAAEWKNFQVRNGVYAKDTDQMDFGDGRGVEHWL